MGLNILFRDVFAHKKENLFFEQDTAIYFNLDGHASLDVNCNGFVDYTSFGVFSNATSLKNQGSSANGAGNRFISGSAETNHQFSHGTNAITYYVDPSYTFTLVGSSGGYSVTVTTASMDATCYTFAPRMANTQNFVSEIYKGESILLNCFPNPASSKITFAYKIKNAAGSASIVLSDIFGRKVKEILIPSGLDSVDEDLSSLNSGIYFYTLMVDGKNSGNKKLILAK